MMCASVAGCLSAKINVVPPSCPPYTEEAYADLETLVRSGEMRDLVAHLKEQERQCRAIEAMR